MKYNFDEVINRTQSFSLKWDGGEFFKQVGITDRFDGNTIPIQMADMDFRCAEPIRKALIKLAEHNIYGYTAVFREGCGAAYYDAIIRWYRQRQHWEIKPEEIIYFNGTVDAISAAIKTFTREGAGVLLNRPIYAPFMHTVEEAGRIVVNSQLVNHDGCYTIDFDDFEAKAADKNTELFLLCHPHNPTGRIWTDDELRRIADICRRHNVMIVTDEIHGDLIRKGQVFHPLVSVVGPENIITCVSANKTFNLAGLQATNVVIQDSLVRERFVKSVGLILPNPFTVAATIAAYTEGEEWLEQLREYLDDNIDWVLKFLETRMPEVLCRRPEGTYILWLDFRGYGLSPEEIREKIYRKANVVLESGTIFDPENGAGFERICVPTRRALLVEAMERIAREFETINLIEIV